MFKDLDMNTAYIIFVVAAWAATSTWWLSTQFSSVRKLVYDKIENLQKTVFSKLEDHEKNDEYRFTDLRNELWTVKVRNAAKDGKESLKLESE